MGKKHFDQEENKKKETAVLITEVIFAAQSAEVIPTRRRSLSYQTLEFWLSGRMENNMRWGTVCVCVRAYLAASVGTNACLSMGVSVWLALRLLAVMSSTAVVRSILVIADVLRASLPRSITDRRVTEPKWQQLPD